MKWIVAALALLLAPLPAKAQPDFLYCNFIPYVQIPPPESPQWMWDVFYCRLDAQSAFFQGIAQCQGDESCCQWWQEWFDDRSDSCLEQFVPPPGDLNAPSFTELYYTIGEKCPNFVFLTEPNFNIQCEYASLCAAVHTLQTGHSCERANQVYYWTRTNCH